MIKDWSNRTILIAEDDEISFKYLDMVLSKRTKMNVLWAINGQMAVDFCKNYQHIDIVIMDIQLPVINGIEAIRQIKSFRSDIPIIVNTANGYSEDYDKCFEAGCDDFITKPVNLHQLLYKIENLLLPVITS
jgi:two-component system, cell cycle response regulator DivK